MSRVLLWVTTALLGGAAVLATSFVGWSAVLVGVPLLLGRERWVAISGFLTGFGVLWTGLVMRQLTAGVERDGLMLSWLGVGLVPIALGAVMASFLAFRWFHVAHHRWPR